LINTYRIRPEDVGLSEIGTDGKPTADIICEHYDLDLLRLDEPWQNEIVPVDHRTPWPGGNEFLGFERLKTLRERFGGACRLYHVRAELARRGIDPAHVTDWGMVLALLSEPAASKPENRGEQSLDAEGEVGHDEDVPRKKKRSRTKTPAQVLKDARERYAVKYLATTQKPTVRGLAGVLECSPATASRLKAWKRRGVTDHETPARGFKRSGDDEGPDMEAYSD
jgi:hypothetical protein